MEAIRNIQYLCWLTISSSTCICMVFIGASYGMLVEIFLNNTRMYAKADCKPFDVKDLVAMKLEEELKPSSPEDLYCKIPVARIETNSVIRKATVPSILNY